MFLIRQNATHKVVIGPVVAVANGYVPVTTLTLGAADEAEAILHDNGTVVDISGYTFAAITTADGYYHLTLQSGISGTVGHMTVVINDDSLCLPVKAEFTVIEEAVYDAFYAASAIGYVANQPVDVNTIKTQTVTAAAGVTFPTSIASPTNITAGTITTATNVTTVNGLAANVITAASINAAALNGKGDWNVGKTGYSLTATTGLGNQTANITGNLSGSVGSVTGAVGSVTGAVGSVTGSVGSVTGAVGSVSGAVGSVTAGVTVTTNNDKTGYALSATGSAALTEDYAADAVAPTLNQILYQIWSLLAEKSISGTTLTAKKLDGATTAMTFTLDDATTPTSLTRTT